jgi:exonuclease III
VNFVNERTILCCSETKLRKDSKLPNNLFRRSIIYGNSSTSKNGTAIILGKDISPHLFQIIEVSEYCLSISLKFKRKTNIILTSVYLPHDQKERNIAIKQLQSMVKLAQQKNYHHMIMGDFNSYPKSSPSIQASTSNFK